MAPDRRRGPWGAVISAVVVLLICGACGAWIGIRQAALDYVAPIVGQNCGEVSIGLGGVSDPDDGERCLWQAYTACKTATLVVQEQGVDISELHVFTVRPRSGGCAVTDGRVACSAIEQAQKGQFNGLLVKACGDSYVDVFVPARPAQEVGHVCGEMYQNVSDTSPSDIGPVSNVRDVTVAGMEACFWQAYTTCARPSTLVYRRLGATSGPINSDDTFVVQRVNGVCALTDASTNLRDAHDSLILTPAACAGLTRARDGGLVARACGPLGDITIPAEQPTPTYAP